ncbi:MAG: type VI secretion system protein TssA [Desulfuromonadaceae bacterium]|nr:type VI secretion system protein TssA [Desulfuromonadaceae bacterium]MDD2849199.1 type VI secretion system protein TssA [Desulfuromonadaceae bacterium]MDD4129752.1 type VI secretion system protein TssA [Desulfuromonadaceae bacterium]
MLDSIKDEQNWKWAAFGKHPTAKDYFRLGEEPPFVEGLFGWVEKGYQLLTTKENATPDFCSWRFWIREAGKNALVCGVVRVSSDSLGRPYPLVIMGAGPLQNWQENWDLLPFAAERTWRQIEYLGANLFTDFKKLEEEIRTIRPPDANWPEHAQKRKALNRVCSPLDPYASFLDIRELKKLAAAHADKPEVFISLDRGPCDDKIMHVSLWHLLARESVPKSLPNAMFMGGALDKAYLAIIKRPLKPADFIQLWSVSAPGLWKNAIGTEYAMDLSAVGKQPISTEKPTGSDVRYEPAYDELQTEVDKLSSPAAAGSVNWEKVVRFATDILMNKSKDLLVASYLAVGLIHTRRNDGIAVGLKVYLEMTENFWDELYPQKVRIRGRVRAIEWWLEKTEAALRQTKELSFPPDQLELIKENLKQLENFLGEHLESSPSLAPIKDYFKGLTPGVIEQQEAIATPRPAAETSAEKPAVSVAPPQQEPRDVSTLREITSQHEAGKALSDGLMKIGEASFYLWQQDLASAQVYRLTRKTAWYAVDELPPATNGQTKIAAPPTQIKNLLFDLRNNGDAEALLKAAETRLPQYIFWLDLNRLAAEALARLGSRFERAHDAVCQETAFLLHRLPGLEELSFSDGTPFATPDTRQWLKGIAFQGSEPGTAPLNTTDSAAETGAEALIGKKIGELQQLVRKGKLIEAMETVQQKLRASASQRENLLWRLSLSQMLVDVGKSRLALPHLEQALKDIAWHGLEAYDPNLAMRGLKLAWLAFDSQTEQKFKDQAQDVLHQIGRFDMPEMVRLSKG